MSKKILSTMLMAMALGASPSIFASENGYGEYGDHGGSEPAMMEMPEMSGGGSNIGEAGDNAMLTNGDTSLSDQIGQAGVQTLADKPGQGVAGAIDSTEVGPSQAEQFANREGRGG